MAKRRKRPPPAIDESGVSFTGYFERVAGDDVQRLTPLVVEKLREKFEAGDEGALLNAVDCSARGGIPLPVWAANAFCDRYMRWYRFQVESLDAAFRVQRPKGMHIKDRAYREMLKPRVVLELLRLQSEERTAVDEFLFARIGKRLGISRSLASKVYYDPENHWRKWLERPKPTATKP